MPAKVGILAGPARSGKTAALLAHYRQVLDGPIDGKGPVDGNGPANIGGGLWLSPTRQAAQEIRERLLENGMRGCFSPAVYTLEQFANALLACGDCPPRFLGRLLKRQLIQRVLTETQAAGQLQYFGPIAETAGLVDLIAGFISDLKRQEVTPQRFAALAETLGTTEKNHELAGIYTAYQRLLTDHQLFDSEERFILANEFLMRQPPQRWGAFANVRCVIVDGFTDFTGTQQQILQSLVEKAAGLEELIIALPLEKETSREDLFHKPVQTLKELQRRHRELQIEWRDRSPQSEWPAAAHLERHLFANPRDVPTATDARRIEIVSTAGQLAEIQWIARRIKDLLVLGDPTEDNRPSHPGEIAVVFRSLDAVAPLVEEVFAEYGIPVSIDSPARLSRAPVLQALLGILRLQAADWPYRQLLAVLANNYFQPVWPQWQQETARAAVEWSVRRLQIAKGRQSLLRTLDHRAKAMDLSIEVSADGEPIDESDAQRQLEHQKRFRVASAILERLAKTLPSADKKHTLTEWIGILSGLIDQLGLLQTGSLNEAEDIETENQSAKSPADLDQSAWQQLKDALAAGNQLESWLEAGPTAFSLPELIARLQDIAAVESLPRDHDAVGRIRVMSAQSVRALAIPYVFVAGLSEQAFPPPSMNDRIYSQAEYRRLNEAGLHFAGQQDRGCEEMLLFYEVVTRPTRQLVLSYPALDDAAQPLSPSPYLIELERCLGIKPTMEISLSPVTPHEHPYSSTERRVKSVAELLDGKPLSLSRLIGTTVSQSLDRSGETVQSAETADSIVAGLQAVAARVSKEFTPFEGLVLGDAARQRLARHYGSEHCWSVSRLEDYAYCPFRFFAGNVLKLEELPELGLETDFGRRGQLAHEALAELHRRLNDDGMPRSPSQSGGENFSKLKDDTLERLLKRVSQGNPLEAALRTIDFKLIKQWLEEYLNQHEMYDSADADKAESARPSLQPAHFEVSFGLKRRADQKIDPISTDTPFELKCGDQTIRLSGRIDRIDVGLVGSQLIFNVLDYKTGSKKSLKDRGVALQLPLYALAVQELLMIDRRAMPWRVGYWFLKDKGFDSHDLPQFFEFSPNGLQETDDWHSLRGTLLARVASLVKGIRGGLFPVSCHDEKCTSQCAFNTVCRIGQIRALHKIRNDAVAEGGESSEPQPS